MATARALSFQSWYGSYGAYFTEISRGTCNTTLASYVANPTDWFVCGAHFDCILSATQEVKKAHMASAAIVLGMIPTFLSLIGPSISQLALLSARRPLLAMLISSGSPALSLDRLFRVEAPREIFTRAEGEPRIPRLKRPWTVLFSFAEYLLVIGATINVLHNSWQLGVSAIIVWKCELNVLPLIWVLGSPFILTVVAIPLQFTTIAKHLRSHSREPGSELDTSRSDRAGFMTREFTPAIRFSTLDLEKIPGLETWAAFVLNVGFCLATLQVLVGVAILSSVFFISVTDAMWVAVRYLISTAVCRLVAALELASMRSKTSADEGRSTGKL